VVSLGRSYLSATPLPTIAQQHLDVLAEHVGEACSLGTIDGVDIVYLARANSSSVMSPRFNVGERLPAYCTSIGHVLFANLEPEDLEERLAQVRFVPYTRHTIISAASLRDYLAQVREEGFAIADQQLEAGFRTIAVPVRDAVRRHGRGNQRDRAHRAQLGRADARTLPGAAERNRAQARRRAGEVAARRRQPRSIPARRGDQASGTARFRTSSPSHTAARRAWAATVAGSSCR
jgi:hypothetical protein